MINILFLSLMSIESVNEHSIYTDLIRELRKNNCQVYIVSLDSKKSSESYYCYDENGYTILKINNKHVTKSHNKLLKGIATVRCGRQYKVAITKYFANISFDLVLYATPPITFLSSIKYIKKRDGAKTYLMLKDIFPQNAVDMGMLSKSGVKSIIYKYFRAKEQRLYAISDMIGCMSEKNKEYILSKNQFLSSEKVEVFPNCIEVKYNKKNTYNCEIVKKKYGIPDDKIVFIYGGNIGKPQGVTFLLECMKAVEKIDGIYCVIVGDGTDFKKVEKEELENKLKNIRIIKKLPRNEYEELVGACDVGLIFLDYKFTIPNFPSRMLSYMEAKMPVIACTDVNTDIGNIIEEGNFGLWCESRNVNDFIKLVLQMKEEDLVQMGERAFAYLVNNYSVEKNCKKIINLIRMDDIDEET